MFKAISRMIFAVMAVVCLLAGVFWVWFVRQYVVNWAEGETAVFYSLTVFWFLLAAAFWWVFRRLVKNDRGGNEKKFNC